MVNKESALLCTNYRVWSVVYEGDLFLKPGGNQSMTSYSIIAIRTMRPDTLTTYCHSILVHVDQRY